MEKEKNMVCPECGKNIELKFVDKMHEIQEYIREHPLPYNTGNKRWVLRL